VSTVPSIVESANSLVRAGIGRLTRPKPLESDPFPPEAQPDWIAIAERPTPPFARRMLTWAGALLVAAIAWATFSHIDRVVSARGKIVTRVPQVMVQPSETAVVREVKVRAGQRVTQGEILATLDPTYADADVGALRGMRDSLAAQIARMREEISGGEKPAKFSSDPVQEALQRGIFESRRHQYTAQLRAFDSEIEEQEVRLSRNGVQRASLSETVAVLSEVEQMRSNLLERGSGSRLQWLSIQSELMKARRELENNEKEPAELKARIEQVRAKRETFISEWNSKTLDALSGIERDYDKAVEQLKKAERRSNLVNLSAPVDAVVLEIAGRSIGSVVREAEPFFTLVPLDVPMELEIEIDPADVGFVHTGDTVRVKLESLPFQRHGTLTGRLVVVGENTVTTTDAPRSASEPPKQVYRGIVELTTDVQTSLRELPANFRLIPGMRVTGEIQIGKRSVISSLLDPIKRTVDEGLQDR
jgi:membrane fusion protein, hemolysin D